MLPHHGPKCDIWNLLAPPVEKPPFRHLLLPKRISYQSENPVSDRAQVYARIIELIEPLNPKHVPLTEDTSFAGDLEMDSLTVMDLVASMEDEWDIVMPLNMLPDLETIGQVADAVAKLVKK
jgi:acyl carrier protein